MHYERRPLTSKKTGVNKNSPIFLDITPCGLLNKIFVTTAVKSSDPVKQ
jgi:hypothetical protein